MAYLRSVGERSSTNVAIASDSSLDGVLLSSCFGVVLGVGVAGLCRLSVADESLEEVKIITPKAISIIVAKPIISCFALVTY